VLEAAEESVAIGVVADQVSRPVDHVIDRPESLSCGSHLVATVDHSLLVRHRDRQAKEIEGPNSSDRVGSGTGWHRESHIGHVEFEVGKSSVVNCR